MKYVVVVCLLTVATLAYVQASLVPLDGDTTERLFRDLQVHYEMMSRFRGNSTAVIERVISAYRDSEEPLHVLMDVDVRMQNTTKTCSISVYSMENFGINSECSP